jgi:DNA-binding beta-propeller fold protein YncE
VRRDATAATAGSTTARLGALLAVASAFLLCAFVPAAMAAPEAIPTYTPAKIFGAPGTEDGQFKSPTHIAVEPGTGNVLVADSGNGRVQVFDPNGGSPSFLTSFGPGTLTTPVGIAIDQATGAIYVSDSGANEIFRFSSDGAPVPTYSQDLGFTSPIQGTAAGQVGSFASAIAVDPATHDVLVADWGNKRVDRFTSTGAVVPSFNGTVSVSDSLTGPFDIAVGPAGALYVVDVVAGGDPAGWTGTAESFVKRFTSTGSGDGELQGSNVPAAVAVDPGSGRVIVAGDSNYSINPHSLYIYSSEGTQPVSVYKLAPEAGTFGFSGLVHGIAIDSGPSGRLYSISDYFDHSASYGFVGAQALDAGAIPGVEIDPPSALTTTTVHLSGQVDPGGQPTSTHFEYSPDGGANWTKTPDQELASKTGVQSVEADLAELAPNTEYQARLAAANPGGFSATSGVQVFSTPQVPPATVTDPPTEVTGVGALLNGKVNPFGLQATYVFEYGETTAYGNTLPAGVAGNGRALRSVAQPVSGLDPETTYHFRLKAESSAGAAQGQDRTFTTGPAAEPTCDNAALRVGLSATLPECRAYEQASPLDKGGATIHAFLEFQASPDGGGIVYKTLNPAGDAEASLRRGKNVSRRSADGWSTVVPEAPTFKTDANALLDFDTIAVSDDSSKALLVSSRALAPGAAEGNANFYLRDLDTGSYTLVISISNPGAFQYFTNLNLTSFTTFIAGAKDFSWVVFNSPFALTPDASEGANQILRWSAANGIELISNSTSYAESRPVNDQRPPEYRTVSADGSEVAFGENGGGAYLWNEGTTTALSVSEVEGSSGQVQPAVVRGVSRDGRYVVFRASGEPLTSDAPAGQENLYRYDVEAGSLEYLLNGPGLASLSITNGVATVSEDGSYVYFMDSSNLTPDAAPGTTHTYVWHEGVVKLVADAPAGRPLSYSYGNAVASPDGSYLVFDSETPLSVDTGVGPSPCGGCSEIYVYDAGADELSCASCPPDGSSPVAGAAIPEPEMGLSNHFPRMVTNQGQVFFNTTQPLAYRDSNGTSDVYVFRDGKPRLISPGTQPFDAFFADISNDGRDVYFTTNQALVSQDRDGATDVYDARVGGGLVSQNPPPPKECLRDDCKATPNAGPELPFGGSEALSGPGNVRADAKKRCGKGRHARKVKGKSRCVKQAKKRAKHNGRHGR